MTTSAGDPNPFHELLDLLANKLNAERPLDIALKWIGLLTDPESGSTHFWNDLHPLWRNRQEHSRIHIWSPEDRPPSARPGHVLIGEKPTLDHFRRGFFFGDRPIYSKLAGQALEWIESVTRVPEPVVQAQAIWLRGRSGCGKSIALLHVLSRISQETGMPILWLGDEVHLLPEAVRRIPHLARPEQTVLIAIDDPYRPNCEGEDTPWREALAELEQLQDAGWICPAVLICCSPTDQADRFTEHFEGRINVHPLDVPHALDDRKRLEEWYRGRTGKEPPTTGTRGDLLVVQLFFEWQTGRSMKAFAQSFRKRLVQADPGRSLLRAVQRVLAANRMYVGYSQAALQSDLAPDQRDVFARLVREHHFAVDEEPGRQGVWMTHPHLAGLVFEAWLPTESKAQERSAVIEETVLRGRRHESTPKAQTAFLWALARRARHDESDIKDLAAGYSLSLISAIYVSWRKDLGDTLPFHHLPAWISLRCRVRGLTLWPDPVAEALAKLVPENRHEVGFRLTCHKLLEHWHQLSESERQETKARLVKVLDVAKDWRECGHIAQDLVLKAEDAQVVALTREAIEREERDMGYRLLVNLVLRRDSSAGVEWLVATAIDWLSRHGRELIAGPLMSALLRRRDLGLKYDIVVTTAIDWCICFSPNRSIERVLRRIPKLPIPFGRVGKVAGMMLDYLNHHGLEPSSSFIIAAFVRPGTLTKIANRRMADKLMSEEACELAIAWLDLFGVDPGWPYVADQLLRLPAEIVDDDKWHRVAARSLARLALESRIRDRDYTLISLVRRRDLLEPDELRAWEQQAKRWLEEANRDATRALKLRDYRHAGRLLAPALPVSAHLGDQLLKISVHDKAVQFRKGAPETACADFEWAVGRLHGNRTWPNSESAMESMETIGLFKETRTIISELGRVLKSDSAENDSDLEHHLQGGLLAVERELEAGDIRSAGHLLAKMLPLADRVDVETRQRTEAAVTRFLALDMAPGLRCGFLVECDHHVADQSWTDEARALDSLDRVGALTRLVLSRMARSGSPLSGERLESALSFAEVLSKELPTRAGLFMPPLLVLAYHVTSRRRGVSISRMALTPASAPTGRSLAGRGLSRTGAPRLAGQRIASVPGSCSKVSRCSCNTL